MSNDFSLVHKIAKAYYDVGLCIVPMVPNGSKMAATEWSICNSEAKRLAFDKIEHHWFSRGNPCGIGIICGKVSGNLEILDFDDTSLFPKWSARFDADFLSGLLIVDTPSGGKHVYYRCDEIDGSKKLAATPNGKTRIETRGQGALIVAPGSPGKTHRTGKQYKVSQGSLLKIPTIAPGQRRAMLAVARTFNERIEPERDYEFAEPKNVGFRPGDEYGQDKSWPEVLEPHGWRVAYSAGDATYWTKPGGRSGDVHASTGHQGRPLLWIWSTSVEGFQDRKGYSKFDVYRICYHDGDWNRAAEALRGMGYGSDPVGFRELYGSYDDFVSSVQDLF